MESSPIVAPAVAPAAVAPAAPRLMTSRFTDATLLQNREYRERTGTKSIYCSPARITGAIPENTVCFVLELNITHNRIEAIGIIRNRAAYGASVYDNGNYNRYFYKGGCRISRDSMSAEEENIMKFFDFVCFRGKNHCKRGSGITQFPARILNVCREKFDLVDYIRLMFCARICPPAAPRT
jgi:hypothetical protein